VETDTYKRQMATAIDMLMQQTKSEEARQWGDDKWSIYSRTATCHTPGVIGFQVG